MKRKLSTACSFALLLAFALTLLVACERTDDAPPAKKPENSTGTNTPTGNGETHYPFSPFNSIKRIPPKEFRNHWTPVQPGPGKKTGFDSGEIHRLGRRVSLRKIKETIPVLLGGITWKDNRGANLFDKYSVTLGDADFIQLNENNDEVTKLFMKLMDDMATNVCKQAIAADFQQSDETKRQFVRFAQDVDKNLRYIRLKFHALHIPATETDGIKQLKTLYTNVFTAKKDNKIAWELVCIATLTAPEFYVY